MWLGKVASDEVSMFQEVLNILSGEWIRPQKEEKVSSNVGISSKCLLTDADWHWEVSSNTSPAIRENGLESDGEVCEETLFAETLWVQLQQNV